MSEFDDYKKKLQGIIKSNKIDVEVDVLTEHFSSIVSQWVPTGCLALDAVIGGGIPVGRIVEIYGDESTGKSLVAEHIASEALSMDHLVVYADSEAAISLAMLEAVGVNTERLLYFIPETMEDVFKTFDAAIEAKPDGKVLILVWDSVAASATKSEMNEDYDKSHVAPQARVMSAALRKLSTKISKKDVSAVLINQTRHKIGVMFGSSVSTTGGNALKFYSSVRIELSIIKKIINNKVVDGVLCRAYVTKNKVGKPFRKCTVPILFDHGMDDIGASLEYLKDVDIIKTKGSWYSSEKLGIEKKFQGKDWPELYDKHFDDITEVMGL